MKGPRVEPGPQKGRAAYDARERRNPWHSQFTTPHTTVIKPRRHTHARVRPGEPVLTKTRTMLSK
jgi:hypothetical protein